MLPIVFVQFKFECGSSSDKMCQVFYRNQSISLNQTISQGIVNMKSIADF